jgi:hypothetical protein
VRIKSGTPVPTPASASHLANTQAVVGHSGQGETSAPLFSRGSTTLLKNHRNASQPVTLFVN